MDYQGHGGVVNDLLAYRGFLNGLDLFVIFAVTAGVVIAFFMGFFRKRKGALGGVASTVIYVYAVIAAVIISNSLLYDGVGVSSISDLETVLYLTGGIGGFVGLICALNMGGYRASVGTFLALLIFAPIVELVLGLLTILVVGIIGGAFDNSWLGMLVALALLGGGGGTVVVIIITD